MTESHGTLQKQREVGVALIAMLIAAAGSFAVFTLAMGRPTEWSVPASLASAVIVGSLAAWIYRAASARQPHDTSDISTL